MSNSEKAIIYVAIALLIVYGANMAMTTQALIPINKQLAEQREQERPADLEVTVIEKSDCDECFDSNTLIDHIDGLANIENVRTLDFSSDEAIELFVKHGIETLPAFIITGEIEKENIATLWPTIGGQKREGVIVIEHRPPYYDIPTGKTLGLVSVTYLSDSACSNCYDVMTNKDILEGNFGMAIIHESRVDASSATGKSLIGKYDISKVPIILVSPEASVYSRFVSAWPEVGDVASDGWYVMRNPEIIGEYRNITGV